MGSVNGKNDKKLKSIETPQKKKVSIEVLSPGYRRFAVNYLEPRDNDKKKEPAGRGKAKGHRRSNSKENPYFSWLKEENEGIGNFYIETIAKKVHIFYNMLEE